DDADAPTAQRIAQHTHDLEAFRDAALRVSELALLDAHARETAEGLLVGDRPAERLAEPVGLRLIVMCDGTHGRTRPADHRIDLGAFGFPELAARPFFRYRSHLETPRRRSIGRR